MRSKPVVFVHHDQHGGRISQDEAKKAWTHVSRRSWKEDPNQLTIRMWAPKPGEKAVVEAVTTETTVMVPYEPIQQAYESRSLQYIQPPDHLRSLETVMYTANIYTLKSQIARDEFDESYFEDHEKVDTDPWRAFADFTLSQFCIDLGMSNLQHPSQNTPQAFACFELASQLLTKCITKRMINYLPGFLGMMYQLGRAQAQNAGHIVKLFLQQISALANLHGGEGHPLSVCTKHLLTMGDVTPEIVEGLNDIRTNITSDPCPETIAVNKFIMKCESRGANYDLDEAEQTYSACYKQRLQGEDDPRAPLQFLSVRMAEVYIKQGHFTRAACVLSDAPAHLEEFVNKGWKYTMPRTTPLSMIGIVWRLRVLGEAFAGDGEHESAEAAFQLAATAAERYLPENDAVRMQAQKSYSKYLTSQGRAFEADQIEKMLDLQLAMYKLAL